MLGARDGRRRAGHTPHSRMLVVGVVAMCKKQRLDDVKRDLSPSRYNATIYMYRSHPPESLPSPACVLTHRCSDASHAPRMKSSACVPESRNCAERNTRDMMFIQ